MRNLPNKKQIESMERMKDPETKSEEKAEKPAKSVMKAIGQSLLKPKKKKVPNGPSTQMDVQVRKDVPEKTKDAAKAKK